MSVGALGTSNIQNLLQDFGTSAKAAMQSLGQAIASGPARFGAALQGAVTIAKADIQAAAGAVKEASAHRLQQLGQGLTTVGRAIAAPPLAVAGAISHSIEARQAAKQEAAHLLTLAATNRQNLRDAIGQDTGQGILHQTVVTKDNPNGATISDLMNDYHNKLTDSALTGAHAPFTAASKAEMRTFVRMGEQIHTAIKAWDGTPPLTMTVRGQTIQVPANLDTARAVSWFLQAKTIVDNADLSRDAVMVGSGTTIVKDPDNKLYKFFASSDNTYGRYSSHFNGSDRTERLDDMAPATSHKGFTAPTLGGIAGQKLQNGIEDFTNKFPGNGGTMLFERLKDGADGVGQVFIKFESVGVPDAIGGDRRAKHGDVESEKATFGMAFNRCFGHTFNFLGGKPVIGRMLHALNLVEAKNQAIINRGEQTKKLVGETVADDYKDLLKSSTLSKGEKTAFKPHDTGRMLSGLDAMLAATTDPAMAQRLSDMKTNLQNTIAERGADLAMIREGAEAHVSFA